MPRKPTGNPRGRPKGTGHLAAPQRLTLWLDGGLFARLVDFAEGQHFQRGTPELAGCVRELLAHALDCPYKSQIRNVPHINEQIENVPAMAWNNNKQTENEQTALAPAPVASASEGPPFDPGKYRLGSACKRGHVSHGTQNLRTLTGGACVMCEDDKKAAKQARKGQREKQGSAGA